MRIAFHTPLKPADHPVPSGDRRMARQFAAALAAAGHAVEPTGARRVFLGDPQDEVTHARHLAEAEADIAQLAADWDRRGPPDLFFCYHPYYKAPDLIGPRLCESFGIPYVTAETSVSARRDVGLWAGRQALVRAGARGAAVNLCLTSRDEAGLRAALPGVRTARLAPFLDAPPAPPSRPEPGHVVTVAMMRPGDKTASFRLLAAALALLPREGWRLTVAGDGPARAEVEALLAPMAGRVVLAGQLDPPGLAALLSRGAVHAWPGIGEAYGLAYLEAQAAGLPVVACRVAGVPEVVAEGETGLLTAPEPAAFAAALARLLGDAALRERMAAAARRRVAERHGMAAAAARLTRILQGIAR